MYAVFSTGGKQFRAEPGTKLRVPVLEAEPGKNVVFDEVLIASDGSTVSVHVPAGRFDPGVSYRILLIAHKPGDPIDGQPLFGRNFTFVSNPL